MNEPVSIYALLKDATDFYVLIAWNGAEDKPFYRAMLLSESRTSFVGRQPFWGYVVISNEEFNRLIEVLEDEQQTFLSGSYSEQTSEYYIEIQTNSQTYHCSLGFDQDTINTLTHMVDVLETEHQKPILDIVTRISKLIH